MLGAHTREVRRNQGQFAMYFRDLTPYEYGRTEPQANVLNVGWLSPTHRFPSGALEEGFVSALERLVASPVNLYRGLHICEFCPPPPYKLIGGGSLMPDPLPGTTGNGEIRIAATNGNTYVAPVLIFHYVVAHGYLPPKEFIDAVIEAARWQSRQPTNPSVSPAAAVRAERDRRSSSLFGAVVKAFSRRLRLSRAGPPSTP